MTETEALRLLGLTWPTPYKEVRRAFRQMAMKYHPDRYQLFTQKAWATRRFIETKEAHDLLLSLLSSSFAEPTHVVAAEAAADVGQQADERPEEYAKKPRDLFDWLTSKIPDDNKPLTVIVEILTAPMLFVFLYYVFFLMLLDGLLKTLGLLPDPNSRSFLNRFAHLMVSTIAALAYLPSLYWLSRGAGGVLHSGKGLILLAFLSGMVILFVLSEWIGFVLASFWMQSAKTDLQALSLTQERPQGPSR